MAEIATRCDLTELLVEQCAHCRRIPDPEQRALGRPFAAAYPGRCRDCDQPYAVGDRIRRVTDDDGAGYLAACCGDDHG